MQLVLLCVSTFAALVSAQSDDWIRDDFLFVPTANLPNPLLDNPRILTMATGTNRSILYMDMTGDNFLVLDIDTFSNEDVMFGSKYSLGGSRDAHIVGDWWYLFSDSSEKTLRVNINDFSTQQLFLVGSGASRGVVTRTVSPTEHYFYVGTSVKQVLEFSVEHFDGFFANSTTPDSGVVTTPERTLETTESVGGFNTLLYDEGSNTIFVGTRGGEIMHVDVTTMSYLGNALTICDGALIRPGALAVDQLTGYLYVACSSRPAIQGYANASITQVAFNSTGMWIVESLELDISPLLSLASSNATLPDVYLNSLFLDAVGGYVYASVSPSVSTYYTGALMRLSMVGFGTTQPEWLRLQPTREEIFYQAYYYPLSLTTRYAVHTVTPAPPPKSITQVGRVVLVKLPPACAQVCVNGDCVQGTCVCQPTWLGAACDRQCPSRCEGTPDSHGTCLLDGSCSCDAGWTGVDCATEICANNCNGHGTCQNELCVCDTGFTGLYCEAAICSNAKSCSSCLSSVCAWCDSTKMCIPGTRAGPSLAGDKCPDPYSSWSFDQCPAKLQAMVGGTAILSMCIGGLFIYNWYTAYRDDIKPTSRLRAKKSWWRSQRSAKIWAMMEQLQFIAMTGAIGVVHPSLYLRFTAGFAWTNFWASTTWTSSPVDYELGAGVKQLSWALGMQAKDFFVANLFWVAVVFTVFHLVVAVIGKIRDKTFSKTHNDIWPFVHDRHFYIKVRIASMAQQGLAVSSTYMLQSGGNDGLTWFFWVLALITFGWTILLPLLIRWLFITNPKGLLQKNFRKRYGSLYEYLNARKLWYASVPSTMRLILGLVVGFGQTAPTETLAILLVVLFIYLIQLVFFRPRPYLDPSYFFLDICRTMINIFTIGMLLNFHSGNRVKSVSAGAQSSAAIIVTLQVIAILLCLITFFVAWLGMHNIHNFTDLKNGIIMLFDKSKRPAKQSEAPEDEMGTVTVATLPVPPSQAGVAGTKRQQSRPRLESEAGEVQLMQNPGFSPTAGIVSSLQATANAGAPSPPTAKRSSKEITEQLAALRFELGTEAPPSGASSAAAPSPKAPTQPEQAPTQPEPAPTQPEQAA